MLYICFVAVRYRLPSIQWHRLLHLPFEANTCYTLYYFRLALLLGPLEMPVLNTTKLVSFALGIPIQYFSRFFSELSCAALRCQLPVGRLTLPMACPSANALLVTGYVYAMCCVWVCVNLLEGRICYFIGIQFELSLFFPVHMRFFCQWKWIFLLFTLYIVVVSAIGVGAVVVVAVVCCCCGCYIAWMQPRRQSEISMLVYFCIWARICVLLDSSNTSNIFV